MNNTEKLQKRLQADLEERGLKPWRIKAGLSDNPYPIGRPEVCAFALHGKATNPCKWKMLKFFGFEIVEKDLVKNIRAMKDDSGREGCTYGDTDHDSVSAVYGYNLALEHIAQYLEKA